MADKLMNIDQILSQVHNGDTIIFGGGGMQRKPMAFVRAIIKSNLTELNVVTFLGGPDVDMLIGSGKVKSLTYPSVTFDHLGLAPNFRRARMDGNIKFVEGSEYLTIASLEAGAKNVPFLVTRAGLGSDILKNNPNCRVIQDAFSDTKVVAAKAIKPDVAFIHVNYADPSGYGQILGDVFIDDMIAKASKKVFLSAEKIVQTEHIEKNYYNTSILRLWTTGIIEIPFGAHFTSCYPLYRSDGNHAGEYLKCSKSKESFTEYLEKYIYSISNNDKYIKSIKDRENISLINLSMNE